MKRSLLSRVVLVAVCSASTVGWTGVRLISPEGSVAVSAATLERRQVVESAAAIDSKALASTPPGVRNRAAWQPSPVPSPQRVQSRSTTDADQSAAPPLPALNSAPALGGAAAMPVAPVIPVAPVGSTVSLSGSQYIPITEQFTTDRLEAMFDGGLPAERGDWREAHFFSRSLSQDASYMIWLPPGYVTSRMPYPVLYLLHGAGGEQGFGAEEWLGYALTEDLDRMLAAGLIEPMIVVVPNGEQSYWMNHFGGPKWGDAVAFDLVKHVDATFRTEPDRAKRAIGGLSMGAHGALQLALNHPDVFSIAGAHSPSLRSFETSPEFFGDQQWFAKHDPLSLVRSSKAALRIATWIDIGHTDEWRDGVEALRTAYQAKQAPLEYRVLEGEHEGWYWEYYLPEYLNFYSSALHAAPRTAYGAPLVVLRSLTSLASARVGVDGAVRSPA